jgi:hypothetical protein
LSLTIVQVAYPFAPVSRDAAGGPEQILALLDEALTGLGHRSVVAAGMSAEAAWRDALLGDAAPTLALMRVLLAGMPAAELESGLRGLGGDRAARLRRVAASHLGGVASLERMVAAGARHGPAGLDSIRDMFDRLVRISPEASVAAYSLGDPGLLDAATAEMAGWMRGRGLLAGQPDLLDFGCGIGRFCLALAPEARTVLGLDLSHRHGGGRAEALRRAGEHPDRGILRRGPGRRAGWRLRPHAGGGRVSLPRAGRLERRGPPSGGGFAGAPDRRQPRAPRFRLR